MIHLMIPLYGKRIDRTEFQGFRIFAPLGPAIPFYRRSPLELLAVATQLYNVSKCVCVRRYIDDMGI